MGMVTTMRFTSSSVSSDGLAVKKSRCLISSLFVLVFPDNYHDGDGGDKDHHSANDDDLGRA